jgi:hypothetical protein
VAQSVLLHCFIDLLLSLLLDLVPQHVVIVVFALLALLLLLFRLNVLLLLLSPRQYAFRLQTHLLVAVGVALRSVTAKVRIRSLGLGGGQIAIVFALEELRNAVSVVVVVVVSALLHGQFLRRHLLHGLLSAHVAHREEMPLGVLAQLLERQLQLFVSCASVGAGLAGEDGLGQSGISSFEGFAPEGRTDGDHQCE